MKRALFGLLLTSLVAVGCRKEPKPEPKTAGNPAETATQKAEPDVTLTFSFQPAESPSAEQQAAAKKLAELIAERSGFGIEVAFPKTYADAIKALSKDKTRVALLSGWAFLRAHHHADGDLFLATERDGEAAFATAWFVTADSKIEKLADLRDKRVAFTAPTSAPGFLFPYAKLIEEEVVAQGGDLKKTFKEVYFTGGEPESLGVLLEGEVDAVAAAATAPALYLKPEQQEKVRSIATIDGVPTPVLAVRADFDMETREKLEKVMLELDDQAELLETVYGTKKLRKRSHGDHMMPIQNAQVLVGAEYMVPEEPEPAPAEAPKGIEPQPDTDGAP